MKAIAAGWGHALALKTDGTVVAWGDDSAGETDVPAGLTNVTAVAGGGDFSLAIRNTGSVAGQVVGWGSNRYGLTTIPAAAQSGVVAIAAGGRFALALKQDGTVIGWGDNQFSSTSIPAAASAPGSGITAIAAKGTVGVALKTLSPSALGSVCSQALAQAGTGHGRYGHYRLVAGAGGRRFRLRCGRRNARRRPPRRRVRERRPVRSGR